MATVDITLEEIARRLDLSMEMQSLGRISKVFVKRVDIVVVGADDKNFYVDTSNTDIDSSVFAEGAAIVLSDGKFFGILSDGTVVPAEIG